MTVPVIRTARLSLRPVTSIDIDAIAAGLKDWDVVQWLTSVPFPYARKDAADFVAQIGPDQEYWAIDAGEGMIGAISLKPDLGYWLAATYHGQHVMSEATNALINWHFSRSDQDVISGHFPANHASRRVLQKLGFVDSECVNELQVATQELVSVQKMRLTHTAWVLQNAPT